MTQKEVLAKAKAVGGWYIKPVSGAIRTKNKFTPEGFECCPLASVVEIENFEALNVRGYQGAKYIVLAADRPEPQLIATCKGAEKSRAIKLRKEMESWCK